MKCVIQLGTLNDIVPSVYWKPNRDVLDMVQLLAEAVGAVMWRHQALSTRVPSR